MRCDNSGMCPKRWERKRERVGKSKQTVSIYSEGIWCLKKNTATASVQFQFMETKAAVKECNSREKWHVSLSCLPINNVNECSRAISFFFFHFIFLSAEKKSMLSANPFFSGRLPIVKPKRKREFFCFVFELDFVPFSLRRNEKKKKKHSTHCLTAFLRLN